MRRSYNFILIIILLLTKPLYHGIEAGQWVNISPKNFNATIYSINFVNSDTGYAVGTDSVKGVYLKTFNGGKSW